MATLRSPFRYDFVGSFLRPQAIKTARAEFKAGKITREQLATMLYEYAKYKGYDVAKAADLSGFVDQGGISAYAVKPMQWAVAHELIFGVGGNALAPKDTATRAQLAAVLHRFCEAFA